MRAAKCVIVLDQQVWFPQWQHNSLDYNLLKVYSRDSITPCDSIHATLLYNYAALKCCGGIFYDIPAPRNIL